MPMTAPPRRSLSVSLRTRTISVGSDLRSDSIPPPISTRRQASADDSMALTLLADMSGDSERAWPSVTLSDMLRSKLQEGAEDYLIINSLNKDGFRNLDGAAGGGLVFELDPQIVMSLYGDAGQIADRQAGGV